MLKRRFIAGALFAGAGAFALGAFMLVATWVRVSRESIEHDWFIVIPALMPGLLVSGVGLAVHLTGRKKDRGRAGGFQLVQRAYLPGSIVLLIAWVAVQALVRTRDYRDTQFLGAVLSAMLLLMLAIHAGTLVTAGMRLFVAPPHRDQ